MPEAAKARRRRFLKIATALLALCVLVRLGIGMPVWRMMRQQSLNRKLIAAIQRSDTPTAIAALQQGADPNCRDEPRISFWQMLRDSIHRTHTPPARTPNALLLATGPQEAFDDLMDAPDLPANTPDNLELIRALLDHGADPNLPDPQGFTALLYAIRWQKHATADLLLTHRADPDQGDRNHVTPLMIAVYMEDTQAIPLLLAHGAHVDRQDDISGQTALMLAITLKRPDCIAPLMARHPDLTLRDHNGKSALDYARQTGYHLSPFP